MYRGACVHIYIIYSNQWYAFLYVLNGRTAVLSNSLHSNVFWLFGEEGGEGVTSPNTIYPFIN